MMMTLKKAMAALLLSACSHSALAQQTCHPRILKAAGAFLHVERFSSDDDDSMLVASACKAVPGDPHTSVAAMIYWKKIANIDEYQQRRAVFLIDNRSFKVVAGHHERYAQAADPDDADYTLTIDTGPYKVSGNALVFGVRYADMESEPTGCISQHGEGSTLSLFAFDRKKSLRPILDMRWAAWKYRQCEWMSDLPQVLETSTVTLTAGKTTTHGYADLQATVVSRITTLQFKAGKLTPYPQRKPMRALLRYDGRQYVVKRFEAARDAWFAR